MIIWTSTFPFHKRAWPNFARAHGVLWSELLSLVCVCLCCAYPGGLVTWSINQSFVPPLIKSWLRPWITISISSRTIRWLAVFSPVILSLTLHPLEAGAMDYYWQNIVSTASKQNKRLTLLLMHADYCLFRVESFLTQKRSVIYFSAVYFLPTCLKVSSQEYNIIDL